MLELLSFLIAHDARKGQEFRGSNCADFCLSIFWDNQKMWIIATKVVHSAIFSYEMHQINDNKLAGIIKV